MAPDIDAARELLQEGKVWDAVRHHLDHYALSQVREAVVLIHAGTVFS